MAAEVARDSYDLVLVTGPGRRARNVVLDLGKPVLGVGPYGCMYFKHMQLKNGHPYT
ncbi:MAG: hypothetical protein ACYST0_00010 [Planctomycetota bacterium]